MKKYIKPALDMHEIELEQSLLANESKKEAIRVEEEGLDLGDDWD